MAYFWTMELERKRWAKLSLGVSKRLIMVCTRHSESLGGFLAPPPKNTSYSIFSRRTASSSSAISSSIVTGLGQFRDSVSSGRAKQNSTIGMREIEPNHGPCTGVTNPRATIHARFADGGPKMMYLLASYPLTR